MIETEQTLDEHFDLNTKKKKMYFGYSTCTLRNLREAKGLESIDKQKNDLLVQMGEGRLQEVCEELLDVRHVVLS